ncbi:metallophosphoesterase family protein [Aliiroseovarius sp. YM-037]|uniref:metallophosphoesterase family protein n=1 Tax=Aliiroseovarius sp. YM-037 TaxID=3341728 RepID=UPI003A8110D3
MKILAFSDVHCDLDACARIVTAGRDADLVIGAGDFAEQHEGLAETMAALAPIAEKAIYVPGNGETAEALRAATKARVLHGEVAEISGITVAGLGCAVPPLPRLPWSYDLSEEDAAALLAPIERCDILVTHSPPKGVADVIEGYGSLGSVAVRDAAERLQPQRLFCGHVHDCWGQGGQIGATEVRNLGPTVNWFEVSEKS